METKVETIKDIQNKARKVINNTYYSGMEKEQLQELIELLVIDAFKAGQIESLTSSNNQMKNAIETKIVLTDEVAPPNYECSECDFTCYQEKKAIEHQKETSHEMWVKRL